jgi:hypothetical protein
LGQSSNTAGVQAQKGEREFEFALHLEEAMWYCIYEGMAHGGSVNQAINHH